MANLSIDFWLSLFYFRATIGFDNKKSTKEITYQRARAALPILVRQVLVAQVMVGKDMTITYDKGTMIYEKTTMTYKELGKEIDAHHRPVPHVLYCIERLLKKLGEHWKEEIPAIQGIVVNQDTRLPGNRVEFLRDQKLDTRSEAKLVMENFTEVIKYQKWEAVLPAFLETPEFSDVKDDPEFLSVLGQK